MRVESSSLRAHLQHEKNVKNMFFFSILSEKREIFFINKNEDILLFLDSQSFEEHLHFYIVEHVEN